MFIVLVVAGVVIYKSIISPLLVTREVPPELRESRVITGTGLLVKSEFYRIGKESSWRDLQDRPKYLAVVGNFAVIDRSLFYLYDAQGKLVYQEVLPEECNGIIVLPPENGSGRAEILVSGAKTVWRYAMPTYL